MSGSAEQILELVTPQFASTGSPESKEQN